MTDDMRDRVFTVQLHGGLGNQLFQYAMARSACLSCGAQLRLDTRTGFWLDFKYRRRFALDGLIPSYRQSNLGNVVRWTAVRGLRRASRVFGDSAPNRIEGCFGYFREATPSEFTPLPRLGDRSLTFVGYWQSPKYFQQHWPQMQDELMVPDPLRPEALAIGREFRQSEVIAIGLRLYEETAEPSSHTRDGRLRTLDDLAEVVRRIRRERPDARCVLFSTRTPAHFADSGLPKDTLLLVPERGFVCAREQLWLLMQCQHHVFSASSLYWWGAWLSRRQHAARDVPQQIHAADNFINRDCVPAGWVQF